MTDTRIQTAIDNARAAIEAMEKARQDIRDVVEELLPDAPVHLTFASVDLGHCITRATSAIHDLDRAKEAV